MMTALEKLRNMRHLVEPEVVGFVITIAFARKLLEEIDEAHGLDGPIKNHDLMEDDSFAALFNERNIRVFNMLLKVPKP